MVAAHPRIATARLARLLRQFPAVAILGARQIGKSTLARTALPTFEHFDLEAARDLDRLRADPSFVLETHPKLVLDEVQRMPEVLPLLRHTLDRFPKHRVVLLGSASPALVRGISESLTGRVGFLDLAGLSIREADPARIWLLGGYPRVHWGRPRPRPEEWYPAYLRTSLEQDVPELGFRLSSQRMRALLTMIAHAQGGLCNLSDFGRSLGVDYHTVARFLDVFEGIFLVRRLAPWSANLGKRLVKSPKLYVRDTGLLHSLLGVDFDRRALLSHPKAGASFETFCIDQIVQHARLADPSAEPFFFRTQTGVEVDLILRLRGKLHPIEIKLGVTPPSTRSLETCMSDLGLRRGWVVTLAHERLQLRRGITMLGLKELLEDLDL